MSLKTILRTIKNAKRFLISTHVNPDPDALASELALALCLRSHRKQVHVINEETVPSRFMFLPAVKMVRPRDKIRSLAYDVAVILDCGEFERIGNVAELIDPDKPVINIDHHITNDKFGSHNLVKPKASSTSEVLFDMLKGGHFGLTRDIALLLYLGIMTDTGSFRYENTSAHTHAIVSELMRFKFSVAELYKKLYESVPMADLKSFTEVVTNFESLCAGKVACVELPKRIVTKFSQDFDLRDKIFGFLRTVKEVEVIVILTEDKPGKTRVNLRSQSRVNVAKLARYFKGGGHSRASGCLIDSGMREAKRRVVQKLKEVL